MLISTIYRGSRKGRVVIKKGATRRAYRVKKIKDKSYYYLGKGNYIRTANAARNNSGKALFSVTITGDGEFHKDINSSKGTGWHLVGTKPVYKEKKDHNGTTWYYMGKRGWIISTDTDKPKTSNTSKSVNSNSDTKVVSDNSDVENNSSEQVTSKKKSNTTSGHTKKQTTQTSDIKAKATSQLASEIAKSFLTQLNAARQENGKRPLELDPTINNFAETRANEQLILYGHTRPNGQDFNYGECIARENLGLNTSASEAAKEALNDFLYNDAGSNWGHRDNLLSSEYTNVGVGVVFEQKPDLSWGNYQYKDFIGFALVVDLN